MLEALLRAVGDRWSLYGGNAEESDWGITNLGLGLVVGDMITESFGLDTGFGCVVDGEP
jgi:hypothetical protein